MRILVHEIPCNQALRMGYSEICFRSKDSGGRGGGGARQGEPAMILVRFEYLRSDSERKLLIGQFDLTHVN